MSYKKLSILIVEDDEIYSKKLATWLASFGVQNITAIKTAERASGIMSKLKPDVIFLDENLPLLKGSEVLSYYKERSPDSTIILMSADFKIDTVATAIQNGADYIFDKAKTDKESIFKIINAVVESKNKKNSLWKILGLFKSNTSENERKILNIAIVEDNEMSAFYLSLLLSESAIKHNTQIFSTATDFNNALENTKPDFVFLDYYLPDGNGKDVLKQIKIKSPKSKVVVVSSQNNPETAIELKSMGIEKFDMGGYRPNIAEEHPLKGISRFKESFGGCPVIIYRYEKIYSRLYRLLSRMIK